MFSVNSETCTDDEGKKIEIMTWRIPRFAEILRNNTVRELCTEKCENTSVADKTNPKFQLKMRFLGKYYDNRIQLYYLSPVPVIFNTSVQVSSQDCMYSIATEDCHSAQANIWNFIGVLNKISTSSISLRFRFEVKEYIKMNKDDTNVLETQLGADLEKLLDNGPFSDVTMMSDDGIEYKVHKAILGCRSSVLMAHFQHSTTESNNVVKSPFSAEVVRDLLTFIYVNQAPGVDEITEDLLAAADYYQLDKLKSLCEDALHKKLTVENAMETLQLAELHLANNLKELTLNFINNHARQVMKTEGWTKCNSVELIKRICNILIE